MSDALEGHRRRRRRRRAERQGAGDKGTGDDRVAAEAPERPEPPTAQDRREPPAAPRGPEPPRERSRTARPRGAWAVALRRRVVSTLTLVAIAIAAFGIGLVLFNSFVMPRFVHHVGEVRVPDLVNLTFEQAEQAVREAGLPLSRSGERFDAETPRGFIVTQDPPADTPVRGRRRVMVVVSLGEEFSSVPALFGESPRSARFLLERAGLRIGVIARAPSDLVGEGLIVDSDPPAESVLPRDASVHLLVSTGNGIETFIMPDLLGREINGVRRQLESLGFTVVTPPSAPRHGTVVAQEPVAGSRITRGTTIELQTSGRLIR